MLCGICAYILVFLHMKTASYKKNPLNETEKHIQTCYIPKQNHVITNLKLKRALTIGVAYISFTCPRSLIR